MCLVVPSASTNRIHTYIHTYMCKHTYTHTYILVQAYIHTYIHTYIHACMDFCCLSAREQAKTCTGRHDWFHYTSTKCAIPDDVTCAKASLRRVHAQSEMSALALKHLLFRTNRL